MTQIEKTQENAIIQATFSSFPNVLIGNPEVPRDAGSPIKAFGDDEL
jgi:hypothetical protein